MRDRATRQLPQRNDDNGHYDRFDPIDDAASGGRGAVANIRPRECKHDRHGRCNEAHPAHDQPERAGSPPAQHDGQLRRARPRKQADRREEIQELLIGQPPTALRRLLAQHGDVYGRSTERDAPELGHDHHHLAESVARVAWFSRHVSTEDVPDAGISSPTPWA